MTFEEFMRDIARAFPNSSLAKQIRRRDEAHAWRTSPNEVRRRKKLNQCEAVAPLVDAIRAMSPDAKKREILRQAYDALTTPDYFEPDEDPYEIAAEIRDANILPDPLNWDTFEDWFRDIPADKF